MAVLVTAVLATREITRHRRQWVEYLAMDGLSDYQGGNNP